MLKEAIEFLQNNAAEYKKAGVRILSTPGGFPGQFVVANIKKEGDYEIAHEGYQLAPPKFVTDSIEGFYDFITGTMPVDNEDFWNIFISPSGVCGYLSDIHNHEYIKCPEISMKLTHTTAWEWSVDGQSSAPKQLIYDIRKLHVGTGSVASDYPHIVHLLPLLSKINVRITSENRSSVSSSNESIGRDVEMQLSMGGEQLPEYVTATVRMYNEVDVNCQIDFICFFDFESKEVVLEPTAQSLLDAKIKTEKAIADKLKLDSTVVAKAQYIAPALPVAASRVSF